MKITSKDLLRFRDMISQLPCRPKKKSLTFYLQNIRQYLNQLKYKTDIMKLDIDYNEIEKGCALYFLTQAINEMVEFNNKIDFVFSERKNQERAVANSLIIELAVKHINSFYDKQVITLLS